GEGSRPRCGSSPAQRKGRDGRRSSLGRGRRDASRAGAIRRGESRARRGTRPGERARGRRGRAALGGRRELEPRGLAGRQGPRTRPRVRRGCTMTTGLYAGYGGRYVPETLIPALDELEAGWEEAQADPSFQDELERLGRD